LGDIFADPRVLRSYSVLLRKDATMCERGRGAHQQAGIATAEAGMVLLDGPDGVAIALTPDAAEATGRSLLAAAQQARGQASETSPTSA
jgi:hypothetical protein